MKQIKGEGGKLQLDFDPKNHSLPVILRLLDTDYLALLQKVPHYGSTFRICFPSKKDEIAGAGINRFDVTLRGHEFAARMCLPAHGTIDEILGAGEKWSQVRDVSIEHSCE